MVDPFRGVEATKEQMGKDQARWRGRSGREMLRMAAVGEDRNNVYPAAALFCISLAESCDFSVLFL